MLGKSWDSDSYCWVCPVCWVEKLPLGSDPTIFLTQLF